MLVSSFGLSTSFLAALRAIGSMGKRPQDQGSTSSKRSTPTRPATEQTPEIPAEAEATMAWLSTIDDVPLISIFEHFANCYVAMPMVGTCRRIFISWTRKRRQFALEELTKLRCWFYKRELQSPSGPRVISVPISILNRIEALIR